MNQQHNNFKWLLANYCKYTRTTTRTTKTTNVTATATTTTIIKILILLLTTIQINLLNCSSKYSSLNTQLMHIHTFVCIRVHMYSISIFKIQKIIFFHFKIINFF